MFPVIALFLFSSRTTGDKALWVDCWQKLERRARKERAASTQEPAALYW